MILAGPIAMRLLLCAPAEAAPAFEDVSDRLLGTRNESLLGGGSGYSGVGVLDFDGDGWLDLYFTDGPGRDNRLLRNDGTGRFVDVTEAAGVGVGTGSRGVLAVDLDGDEATDLVLTGDLRAPTRVLRNRGDGTFVDVTRSTGLSGAARNISAHAADVDGDGWLDVYFAAGVLPAQELANTLYRNQGDGTFVEVGAAARVATGLGACAATFTHLDDDDDIDLVVANCGGDLGMLPFEVYRNAGDGSFDDITETSRVWAVGHWMGLALGDFDGDLRLDFFATNSGVGRGQPHALYRNNGDGTWSDVGPEVGVSDWEFGWGTVAEDFDNDGLVDLFYTGRSQVGDRYASPGHLFRNLGDGTFAAPVQPLDLAGSWTSGVAAGDFDGDGFVDLVITRTAVPSEGETGEAVLLRNLGNGNRWLTVRPRGRAPNTGGVGARIYARAGDTVQLREVTAGSSYQSTSSPWPTFGLGDAAAVEVCVRWPLGGEERYGPFDADQRVDVVEGGGEPEACGASAAPASDSGAPPPPARCGCRTGQGMVAWSALMVWLVSCRRKQWSA